MLYAPRRALLAGRPQGCQSLEPLWMERRRRAQATAARLEEMLPPLRAAHTQVEAIWLLTCYQYGHLGHYGDSLTDAALDQPLRDFHQSLSAIEHLINWRNQTQRRGRDYAYLKPSRIPNSSNI